MSYPFDVAAWRRFYRALAELEGRRAWGEATFRAALAGANALGWASEDDAPVPSDTVLIVGHQRSGTTWLHRMLASHPDASAMPLHALVLPGLQAHLDRPRLPLLDRLQDRIFGPLDPVHRIRLHEPEEDEFLLWALFRSPMNALDRPWPADRAPAIEHDDVAFRFYAEAVARSVRRTGRRHVGKNPHFTHALDRVRRVLPVHTVLLLRDPREAIPSRLSLIRAIWQRRGLGPLQRHHIERIYASSLRCYRGRGADLVVHYDDLVRDPIAVVRRVHERFGLPYEEAWVRSVGQPRTGPSRHRYDLDEFGLSEERLRGDLPEIFAALGLSLSASTGA